MAGDVDAQLDELPREQCLELVASLSVGRIAVGRGEGPPLVVPVNYVLDGEVVVFRSALGTKLAAVRQGRVSFQVDFVDPFHRAGWSVLIEGTAYEATSWEVGHLKVEPWAGGERHHWVRVVPERITGRRIRLPLVPSDPRGYR